MDLRAPTYVVGPLFLLLLLAFCFITVIGVKSIIGYIKERLSPPAQAQEKPKEQPSHPKAPRKRRVKSLAPKGVRSIEIDASEVDRIYVKKSS